jgi:uncharacterized membrane protein YqjE
MHSANLTQKPVDPEYSSTSESDFRFFEESQKLGLHFGALAHNHVRLAALEIQQAGEGLIKILMISFFTFCLLFSAWLSLLGALVIVVIENNIFSHVNTFLMLALLHCVLVLVLIRIIRFQRRLLMFSATVKSLEPSLAVKSTEKTAENCAKKPKEKITKKSIEKPVENYVV